MNSINDILNDKADDLFQDDNITTDTVVDTILTPIEETTKTDNDIDVQKLKATVYQIKDQLDSILRILDGKQVKDHKQNNPDTDILNTGERIIEGVFNGEKMIGADGKEYSIPPNYASKSKLVEGDMLKLTITNNGSFIFKQIGPIERKSLIGEIVSNGEQYSVLVNGRSYKVITASITFYKGKTGDEAVILVPKDGESDWAAVDNVINK
ncbi:MAG TPA: hypothetical protein DEB09_00040 [Candidatus Magasanikbacteria bacterium]|nr:hypothetical protein [Candidatus Magasanikbacteria bacterium]